MMLIATSVILFFACGGATGASASEPLPCCIDVGQGYFCGDGGCDCDHCCGTPWEPARKDCCHSHCTQMESPSFWLCDGQRCNSTCFSHKLPFCEGCGCAQAAKNCLEGHCSTEDYGSKVCGESRHKYDRMGCGSLSFAVTTICNGNFLKGVKQQCGGDGCKNLVEEIEGKTCREYCDDAGLTCVGAWEEQDDNCAVDMTWDCDHRVEHTSDAICQCGDRQPGREVEDQRPPPPANKPFVALCLHFVDEYIGCLAGNSAADDYEEESKGVGDHRVALQELLNQSCVTYENATCSNFEAASEAASEVGGEMLSSGRFVNFDGGQEIGPSTCEQACHDDWHCTGGVLFNNTCRLLIGTPLSIERFDVIGPPGKGLSWHAANHSAYSFGGRLPSSQEFEMEGITDGNFDFWQPISDDVGVWIQSGDAGRIYMTEGDKHSGGWHMNDEVHGHRPSTPGTQHSGTHSSAAMRHFYVAFGGGEQQCKPESYPDSMFFSCSGPKPEKKLAEGECEVALFEECFEGKEEHFGIGHHELHSRGIGDMAKSIKVMGDDCYAVLWEHGHNSGASWEFREGEYDCDEFRREADENSASYMEVGRGHYHNPTDPGGNCARPTSVSRADLGKAESMGYTPRYCN